MLQGILIAIAVLALLLLLPRLLGSAWRGPIMEVQRLRERIVGGEPLLLLDVRTTEELGGELGHLPGITHIPLHELQQRSSEIADWKDKPVAILCRTDVRSAKAAGILAAAGFSGVEVVKGGMTAWNQAGWPVER